MTTHIDTFSTREHKAGSIALHCITESIIAPFRLIWYETSAMIHHIVPSVKTPEVKELEQKYSRVNMLRASNEERASRDLTKMRESISSQVEPERNSPQYQRQQNQQGKMEVVDEEPDAHNFFQRIVFQIFHPPDKETGGVDVVSTTNGGYVDRSGNIATIPTMMATAQPSHHESVWWTMFHSIYLQVGHFAMDGNFHWLNALGSLIWMCLPTTIVYRMFESVNNYFAKLYAAMCETFQFKGLPFATWAKQDLDRVQAGQGSYKYAFAMGVAKHAYDANENIARKRRQKLVRHRD